MVCTFRLELHKSRVHVLVDLSTHLFGIVRLLIFSGNVTGNQVVTDIADL